MGVLRRISALLAAALLVACDDGTLDPPLASGASAARLQEVVDSVVALLRIPGAVVGVRPAGGSEILLASGTANLSTNAAMDPAARVRVASVTKTMVSTVVLQLVDEQLLGLDDTIAKYLPGAIVNADKMTVRQLLNHTSGAFDYTDDAQFVADVVANPTRSWLPSELL